MSEQPIETQEVTEAGYEIPEYRRFVRDMTRAGFEVEHYRGRFGYEGPAIRVDYGDHPYTFEVKQATRVPLQSDQMGLGSILYPK